MSAPPTVPPVPTDAVRQEAAGPAPLRVMSVRQPWAWAILEAGKDVENRVRTLGPYRGPVAIHASRQLATPEPGLWLSGGEYTFVRDRDGYLAYRDGYPSVRVPERRGHIIGVVNLTGVHHDEDCFGQDLQRLANLYTTDREALAALPDSGAGGLIGRASSCSPWAQPDVEHLTLADPRLLSTPIPWVGGLGLRHVPDDVASQIWADLTP